VEHGTFVISLDFELMWGVRDKRTIADYGPNILGVREVVPALLDVFAERDIACTWATVGFLFFATDESMRAALPARKPGYADARLSSYRYLGEVGADEARDPYHFGLSLIRRIRDYPRQEIGTHTFSHLYCMEEGVDLDALRADLEAARAAAGQLGITLASIAFPRNQFGRPHLSVCRDDRRRHGRRVGKPFPAAGERKCAAGTPATLAHHVGDGGGGAPPKALSSVVAPA
jgi:hypothetical protein